MEWNSDWVDADEASFILGVGRSRLSQLTSAGAFAPERIRKEGRVRLYYRRTELEAYREARPLDIHTSANELQLAPLEESSPAGQVPVLTPKPLRPTPHAPTLPKALDLERHTQSQRFQTHLQAEVQSLQNALRVLSEDHVRLQLLMRQMGKQNHEILALLRCNDSPFAAAPPDSAGKSTVIWPRHSGRGRCGRIFRKV